MPHFFEAALTTLVGFWCVSLTLFLVALGVTYARSLLEARAALRKKEPAPTGPYDLPGPAAH